MTAQPKTITDFIYNAAENHRDKIYIKYINGDKMESFTFGVFLNMIEKLAGSLYELGLRKGDKAGIISDNSWQWMLTDQAILSIGATDIPRGSDSTAAEITYILKHSDAKICFAENPAQVEKILSSNVEYNYLTNIILFYGEISEITCNIPDKISITKLADLMNDGERNLAAHKEAIKSLRLSIKPDDLATLIYTSGTTGTPKGVMLTHDNIVADIDYMMRVLYPKTEDRWVSVLPIWHVYERTVEYAIIATGGLMAYAKPTAKQLLPVLSEIKPTFMVSVPRIWESLYNGIMIQLRSGSKFKHGMFNFFLNIGLFHNKNWKRLVGMVAYFEKQPFILTVWRKIYSLLLLVVFFPLDSLGNALVFSKIRKKIGGKMKTPISGGGKLPDYLDDFFNAIKINILEGYGMTETSPVICVRTDSTLVSKTVGRALPEVEVMIGDDNFTPIKNQQEKGTIYVKGRIVMKGYYKDPENTLKVLKDGWLNTGDLGRKSITGELQIVGRVKETIVLTGGENIEPAPIEEKLLEDELISYVMLVGQDEKYLGALIVPKEDNLTQWANNNNITHDSYDDLCKNKAVTTLFTHIIKEKINVKNGFKSIDNIKYIAILSKQFEIGDELTRSLKMKRNVIMEKYDKVIKNMFKNG